MKEHGVPIFHASTTCITIHLYQKNQLLHWLCYNKVPWLNAVKILTVRLAQNFQIFKSISISSDYLPAYQPAIRPTSTRSMAPDLSLNKDNHV